MSRSRLLAQAIAISLPLAGCVSVPGTGPRTADIEQASPNYTLIDLNPATVSTVSGFVANQRREKPVSLPPAPGWADRGRGSAAGRHLGA